MPTPGEVTLLLQKAGSGDRAAADELYRLVERDLRAIVGKRKRRFGNPHDASTTVLVDEAFCRLVGGGTPVLPHDRASFFSYAANKIHDLLVDAARAGAAQKRGGERKRADLDVLDPAAPSPLPLDDADFIIDLREALDRFETIAPDECLVFRIYYFLGCTFDETAKILELSATEVKRRCKKTQLWLRHELKDYSHDR